MKFAIRDDDLNFFYSDRMIDENLSEIFSICPISMSVIPFVKGNWRKNVDALENCITDECYEDLIEEIKLDKNIYLVGDNQELVNYIKKKIYRNEIYLTLHGVYHQNQDDILPIMHNNFAIGAEFFTKMDMKYKVEEAIKYLENIFEQKITIFTPPQNKLSFIGYKSLVNNNLNLCTDFPFISGLSFENIRIFGIANAFKICAHRIKTKRYGTMPYPKPIKNKKIKIIDHVKLQPRTDINKIYRAFDYVYKNNGSFVLSTHSYAFSEKMKNSDKTMKNELINFLNYVKSKTNVDFVSIDKIIED